LGDPVAVVEYAFQVVGYPKAYSAEGAASQGVWKDMFVEQRLAGSDLDECIEPVKQLVSEEHVIRDNLPIRRRIHGEV
jgi:hypothetical protein